MKITRARMEVIDVDDRPVSGQHMVKLKGGKGREIDLRTLRWDRRGAATVEIRLHVIDADLAADRGQESTDPYVLMDWFQVHDATVSISDGRITVIGYQMGVEGSRRDGESPVEPGRRGNPIDDYDRPLARVRWDLW